MIGSTNRYRRHSRRRQPHAGVPQRQWREAASAAAVARFPARNAGNGGPYEKRAVEQAPAITPLWCDKSARRIGRPGDSTKRYWLNRLWRPALLSRRGEIEPGAGSAAAQTEAIAAFGSTAPPVRPSGQSRTALLPGFRQARFSAAVSTPNGFTSKRRSVMCAEIRNLQWRRVQQRGRSHSWNRNGRRTMNAEKTRLFMPVCCLTWTSFCLSPRQWLACGWRHSHRGLIVGLSTSLVASIDAEADGADLRRRRERLSPASHWLATIAATSLPPLIRGRVRDDRLAARGGAARRPLNPAMRSKPSPAV